MTRILRCKFPLTTKLDHRNTIQHGNAQVWSSDCKDDIKEKNQTPSCITNAPILLLCEGI